jgi:serine/threonine protein kinase
MSRQQLKDEYEIAGELGAGGMATVYKAVQKSLDRQVAIKELKKAYHADDQIVRRFERESQVAASLQHENIVHIYDYWKKPTYCIVMEYVDGANLADVIEKIGALPIDVGIMISIQVCNALDYAHMRGLIHRDIKPSNIMIKRNGEVKLMDFGIAQSRNLESLTIPGTLIGTPAYMSPEQVLGQHLDTRSDIFSFGIVLYELFTGVKPFADDDERSVSAKILKDNFRAPRRVNSDIPWGLQRVIKKCLRKKPKRRYDSMLEVEKKLGKRLAGRTTKAASLTRIAEYLVSMKVFEAAPAGETVIITSKVSALAHLRRYFVSAAMLLLFATGAAVYYTWTKTNETPMQPPTVSPAVPLIGAPLLTRPVETAPPSALQTGTSTTTIHPVPQPSTVSTSVRTSQSSSVLVERSKAQSASTKRKTGSAKKKKKKKTVSE